MGAGGSGECKVGRGWGTAEEEEGGHGTVTLRSGVGMIKPFLVRAIYVFIIRTVNMKCCQIHVGLV